MKLSQLCSLLIVGLSATLAFADDTQRNSPQRIGIYDSRSVAVAFSGSALFNQWMASLHTEHDRAKAAGDAKRVKELEAEGAARQKRAHEQAFSTAPVDDILVHVKDRLPAIQKQAGVTVLVSKWDETTLAKYSNAERIDVTEALIDTFKPTEKQRKNALAIQKQKPRPLQPVQDPP